MNQKEKECEHSFVHFKHPTVGQVSICRKCAGSSVPLGQETIEMLLLMDEKDALLAICKESRRLLKSAMLAMSFGADADLKTKITKTIKDFLEETSGGKKDDEGSSSVDNHGSKPSLDIVT